MRYGVIAHGKRFEIKVEQPLAFQCCDCGLVHTVTFKVKGDKLVVNLKRDVAETKKVRGQRRVKRSIRELKG